MNMMKGNTIKITSKNGTPVFLEVNLELYCTLVQQKKNRNGYVYNVATLFYKIKYQHITNEPANELVMVFLCIYFEHCKICNDY